MRWVWLLVAASAWGQAAPAPPPDRPPPEGVKTVLSQQQASIEQQRTSVRKQAETVGVWLPPKDDLAAAAEAPCDPIDDSIVAPVIDGAAKAHELRPELLRAVIGQESAFRPCAVSAKGAEGLMQLMPDTLERFGVKDGFNPKENIEAGAKFLKELIDKYKGDLRQALGAYNAGPEAVDKAGGIPPIEETQDYVKAILEKLATQK